MAWPEPHTEGPVGPLPTCLSPDFSGPVWSHASFSSDSVGDAMEGLLGTGGRQECLN